MIARAAPAPTSHPPNASSIRKNDSDILRIMVMYTIHGIRTALVPQTNIYYTHVHRWEFISVIGRTCCRVFTKPENSNLERWALCFQFKWLLCSFVTIERCKSFRASRLNIMERRMVESWDGGEGSLAQRDDCDPPGRMGMHIKVTAHKLTFSIFNGHFINFEHVFNILSGMRFTNYVKWNFSKEGWFDVFNLISYGLLVLNFNFWVRMRSAGNLRRWKIVSVS